MKDNIGKRLGRFIVAALACLFLVASLSLAKLPEPEMREWTSAAGTKITAKLVSVRGDSVVLTTEAGKTMTVKLAQLSATDQDYAKTIREAMAAVEAGAASGNDSDVTEDWYKEGNRINLEERRVIENFSLEAGGKRRFQIDDADTDNFKVYFTVDIGSELSEKYGKEHVIRMEQSGSDDWIATNIGGGMGFTPKGGKLRMEVTNSSDKTVRIAITVDRKAGNDDPNQALRRLLRLEFIPASRHKRGMTWRTFLCAVGAFIAVATDSAAVDPTESLPIWPGLAPGETTKKTGDALPPRETDKPTITRVENITAPTLDVFLPEPDRASGVSVLILPGGGFGKVVPDLEGSEAAAWLNKLGIAAFVLNYRTTTGADQPITEDPWRRPAQDSQRALRWLRSNADKYLLDPAKIGLLGFSAGGQVAAIHATNGGAFYNASDGIDREVSHRPNFLILIYPWRVADEKTEKLMEAITVDAETPPAFIVHTDDDRSSSLGAALIYLGLKKHGVSGELHVYQNGGHGYGIRDRPDSVIGSWTDRCTDWLVLRGLTNRAKLKARE